MKANEKRKRENKFREIRDLEKDDTADWRSLQSTRRLFEIRIQFPALSVHKHSCHCSWSIWRAKTGTKGMESVIQAILTKNDMKFAYKMVSFLSKLIIIALLGDWTMAARLNREDWFRAGMAHDVWGAAKSR